MCIIILIDLINTSSKPSYLPSYLCARAHTHACMHACIHTYLHTHARMHVHTHIYTHAFVCCSYNLTWKVNSAISPCQTSPPMICTYVNLFYFKLHKLTNKHFENPPTNKKQTKTHDRLVHITHSIVPTAGSDLVCNH